MQWSLLEDPRVPMYITYAAPGNFPSEPSNSRVHCFMSCFSVPYSLTFLLLIINYLLLWDDQTPTSALCIASNGAAHPVSYGVMLGVRILVNLSSAAVYVAIVMYLSRVSLSFLIKCLPLHPNFQSHGRSLQSLSSHQKKTHRNAKITLGQWSPLLQHKVKEFLKWDYFWQLLT